MLLADRILILEKGKIVQEIKKEELVEKANILKKYEIKLPTILEILAQLKQNEINLKVEKYTIQELTEKLTERLKS